MGIGWIELRIEALVGAEVIKGNFRPRLLQKSFEIGYTGFERFHVVPGAMQAGAGVFHKAI
ncbi:hypothetical protein Ct61P_05259 [Colletotrichum tofieldiae]|nr:hypothetical protein Ct61P_05259 [Colletotrichum tofieldiae]